MFPCSVRRIGVFERVSSYTMAVSSTARSPSWLLIAAALPFLFMFVLKPVRSGEILISDYPTKRFVVCVRAAVGYFGRRLYSNKKRRFCRIITGPRRRRENCTPLCRIIMTSLPVITIICCMRHERARSPLLLDIDKNARCHFFRRCVCQNHGVRDTHRHTRVSPFLTHRIGLVPFSRCIGAAKSDKHACASRRYTRCYN